MIRIQNQWTLIWISDIKGEYAYNTPLINSLFIFLLHSIILEMLDCWGVSIHSTSKLMKYMLVVVVHRDGYFSYWSVEHWGIYLQSDFPDWVQERPSRVSEYLRSKMKQVAPNLGTLIGDQARPYFPYPIFWNVTFIQFLYIQYLSSILNCLYTIEIFINHLDILIYLLVKN